MHWSGSTNILGSTNGNNQTYSTLVSRNLACQLATDTNDVWLMQPFYQNQVEMAWCATDLNLTGISIEMDGNKFTENPPPPDSNELNLTYKAVCELMKQYHLKWTQIVGHYNSQIESPYSDLSNYPNNGCGQGTINCKYDPGRNFMEQVFLPEMKKRGEAGQCS